MKPEEGVLHALTLIDAEAVLLATVEFLKPCPSGGEHEIFEHGPYIGHYCFQCWKCDAYGANALHVHVDKTTGKVT